MYRPHGNVSFLGFFNMKMCNNLISIVGLFALILFSFVSGEIDESPEYAPQIPGNHGVTRQQFYEFLQQLPNFKPGEDGKIRLSKDMKEKRRNNLETSEQCCGMWGRSLRNRKIDLLLKKSQQSNDPSKY